MELVGLVEVKMRSLLLAVVRAPLGSLGVGVREGPVGLGKSSLGLRVGARTAGVRASAEYCEA